MQYSPKLKKAMNEIQEILDKHDIAGAVVLHTPGFGEHLIKVNPSYSCAFLDNTPGKEMIRVRTRLAEDYDGNSAKRNQAQQDTVNMFDTFANLITRQAVVSIDMIKLLEEKFEITRTGKGGTSTTQQNN